VIIDSIYPTVATDDFARRFSQRGGNLMWLLGAGASAAAGIPTAWDMIWEFKQQLYVSQRRVSPRQVADLANPAVRRELQSFIDGIGSLPAPDSPDEYAALFEGVYPSIPDVSINADVMCHKLPSYRPLHLFLSVSYIYPLELPTRPCQIPRENGAEIMQSAGDSHRH
jgi:hypothetical protein